MQDDGKLDPLAAFVRERRVHFTVVPEKVVGVGGAIPVGFDVRLHAWHGHEQHDVPACAVCADLEGHLRELAEYSASSGDGGAASMPAEIEIDVEYATLHDSPVAPGTDDVALDLRLLVWGHADHSVGDAEQRYLRQVKARLKALGAREA